MNFFQPDKILQLRELALKEVAGQVERKVDYSITYQKIHSAMNGFWPASPVMQI
jgi:K+-sensing histidine kinase KdpD